MGKNAADEAADFGRRSVGNAVIDARRNLSAVCGRCYPVFLDLHRFFTAISRAVVNHDGRDGTAPDPMVWSAGAPRVCPCCYGSCHVVWSSKVLAFPWLASYAFWCQWCLPLGCWCV